MKKILSFLMIAALATSLASCGSSDDDTPAPDGTTTLSTPAPTVDAASISKTGFTVAWPAVANAASYLYKIDNGAETAVNNTSVVISGLTAGNSYTVSVMAVSGNTQLYTNSAWGTVTATTLAQGDKSTLSTPAPTVDPASITAEGFTVTWPAVSNAGSYVYKVDNGTETPVTGTSATLTGLTAATTYTVSVKAVTSDVSKYADSAWGTVSATTAGGSTGGSSLDGSAYFPIVLDGVTYEKIMNKVVADFRPNEETSFLYVWDNTYQAGNCTGPNFYGEVEAWTSLVMGTAGWAGAGFCVNNGAQVDKLAQIMTDPSAWYLHIGMKSAPTDNFAHTVRLADGSNTVDLVLVPGGQYNYTRDNEWQEIEVPMTYFTGKGINYRTGNADTDFNVVAVVDADNQPVAVAGTTINYDALFIYKK